jgi:tetratricopeptide (TPR) repeat protein
MKKDNLVFALIGIIIGIIGGVFLANQSSQTIQHPAAPAQQSTVQSEQGQLPEGHPQIDQAILTQIAEQKEILQRDPENQTAIIALANLNYDLNNHAEATQWFEKALLKDPNNINLITDMGTSYLQIQNIEKAVECYKKSLAIDPKHYQTLMNLGIAKMTAGDKNGAAEAWEKLIAYYPQDPNIGMLKDAIQKMRTEG